MKNKNDLQAADASEVLGDENRLRALGETGLVGSPREEAFDRLTRLACKLIGCPASVVTLVDDHLQFFKSSQGLSEPWATARQTPLSHSFCKYVVMGRSTFVVENATEHPLVKDNLAIPDMGVMAYAGVPLSSSNGEVLGAFAVIDSTPRKWTSEDIDLLRELAAIAVTEIELRMAASAHDRVLAREVAARSELEEVTQHIEELLYTVTHDLKNPLAVIKGFSQMMLRGLKTPDMDPERMRAGLKQIETSAERMNVLIDELLDVGRIQVGQPLNLRMQDIDLLAMLRRVAAEHQRQAPNHVVRVEAEAPSLMGRWDQGRLERVFGNLVSNAVKYSPAGGEVVIKAGMVCDTPQCMVKVSVQDQGIGIPEDDLPHVFDWFHRGQNVPTGVVGTGIGLAGSSQIVKEHGGSLEVSSVEGEGSTFTVCIPLQSPESDAPIEAGEALSHE